ncbi:DoxX family protein [Nocardia sp. NPDC051911]|uniref:DoxX family protein n=1 Tax=Nocardia sp. NPDC051911 TaxID=3154648 RepID=UPI00342B33C8
MSLATIITAMLVLLFIVTGASKALATSRSRTDAEHFAIPVHRFRLLGLFELALAAALAIGVVVPPLGAVAATAAATLMVAALIYHRLAHDQASAYLPAVVTFVASVALVTLIATS